MKPSSWSPLLVYLFIKLENKQVPILNKTASKWNTVHTSEAPIFKTGKTKPISSKTFVTKNSLCLKESKAFSLVLD